MTWLEGTPTRNQKAQIWLEAQWSLFGPGPMDVPMICWTYCWALEPNKIPFCLGFDQRNMLSIPIENFKTLATKLPPISINVSKKKSTNQLIPSVTWLNWTGWLRCQNSPLHGELPIKPPKDMHYKPLAISVSVLAKMKREFRDKPTMTV